MRTKEQEDRPPEGEIQARRQQQVVIGEQVIHLLGRPDGLHSVQVRKLWDDCYRVNVFVGPDPVSVVIAHSFFLVTDGSGKIINANPAIQRRYA
jgi:hypothetical protein